MDLQEIGKRAKAAASAIAKLTTLEKNALLQSCAQGLVDQGDAIIAANQRDIQFAKENGITGALLDRLTLNNERIAAMAEGIKIVAKLEDPIGEIEQMKTLPNGLMVGKKRVPLGVIGMIYEARPNVTADAFALCFKAGSACILRGGKEAIESNKAIVKIFQEKIENSGYGDSVQLIEDTSRDSATQLMQLRYLDVLIPRGSAGLIQSVVENSKVPVIETGIGNCHVYVDQHADLSIAADIIINAKTQRPGVCNACESVLVHEDVIKTFLPVLGEKLKEKQVEIRGDSRVLQYIPEAKQATDEDYGAEFLDYILSVKTVESIEEAIIHIEKYGTGHSEAIITENYSNAQKFLNEVDAACVYVNASTRFTDGFEFGFGAEIGISTQKLHARGPMGLKEMTTYKYIIYGNGQIRQ